MGINRNNTVPPLWNCTVFVSIFSFAISLSRRNYWYFPLRIGNMLLNEPFQICDYIETSAELSFLQFDVAIRWIGNRPQILVKALGIECKKDKGGTAWRCRLCLTSLKAESPFGYPAIRGINITDYLTYYRGVPTGLPSSSSTLNSTAFSIAK